MNRVDEVKEILDELSPVRRRDGIAWYIQAPEANAYLFLVYVTSHGVWYVDDDAYMTPMEVLEKIAEHPFVAAKLAKPYE